MLFFVAIFVLAFACRPAHAGGPQNLGFEDSGKGDIPGWFIPPVCAEAGWNATIVPDRPAEGKSCARLSRDAAKDAPQPGAGFGNLMQSFDAKEFRGKRIVLTAKVRLLGVAGRVAGRTQCWLRVDRENQQMGFFDNCGDRPIMAPEWQTVRIAGDVAEDATNICVGLMVLGGDGPADLDAVTITATDQPEPVDDPPRALTEPGLANLEALTRVLGYVRHYCPSDEAAAVDWNRFIVDAIDRVEPAANAEELARSLRSVLAPIAPALTLSASPIEGPFDPTSMVGPDDHPLETIRWHHRGFNPSAPKQGTIYFSERVKHALSAKLSEGEPAIGECLTTRLVTLGNPAASGVWLRMPIVLYVDEHGTLPRPSLSFSPSQNAPDLTADSRAVRLAGVIVAWNVLRHHYPYFDVVRDDWTAALGEALKSAATDADSAAFQFTLERLVAHLHDGHGGVSGRSLGAFARFSLPLVIVFVGDEPIVLNAVGDAVPKGVRPGDALVSIDGKPVAEFVEEARLHESAATTGYFHSRAARRIARRFTSDPVPVVLRSPDSKEHTATLTPVTFDRIPPERSGPIISEPKPGVWYIDLDRATDKDLTAAMPSLAKATGIVFDMRGYPNNFSMGLLGHLTDAPVLCARWEIPLADRPDQDKLTFDHSRWNLPPLKPRLAARVAFITDGRAISAAETFLGIVEAYKLAEIVGEPTAGTNGNVNTISLPGGFTIAFTGMKVLKHDGSQHHGIGIVPTVPAHRTIAGIAAARDEMLEKAIEVVSSPAK
jgi:hypothetical protein